MAAVLGEESDVERLAGGGVAMARARGQDEKCGGERGAGKDAGLVHDVDVGAAVRRRAVAPVQE